jgi:hypothetical protein
VAQKNPYEPPKAAPFPAPTSYAGATRSSASAILGVLACVLFAADVACGWCIRLLDLTNLDAIQHRRVEPWVVSAERGLEFLAPLPHWGGVIVFFVWIYGAAKDTRTLRRPEMAISPAGCIGWYFAPIANLYMPYRAMAEITIAFDPADRGSAPPSVLVWWLLFVGGNLLTLVGGAIGTVDVATKVVVDVLGTALHTGSVLALFFVVNFITRGQEHYARQLSPR